MSDNSYSLLQLIKEDKRYALDAYIFVQAALSYAADALEMGSISHPEPNLTLDEPKEIPEERHLTGQQLCEAIRQYALNQFGYLAKTVLNSWGVETTSAFGDIVYNMISAGMMRKSASDRRSHFDGIYDFHEVFTEKFQIGNAILSPLNIKGSLGSEF